MTGVTSHSYLWQEMQLSIVSPPHQVPNSDGHSDQDTGKVRESQCIHESGHTPLAGVAVLPGHEPPVPLELLVALLLPLLLARAAATNATITSP